MSSPPSLLSLSAASLYVLVVCACLVASGSGFRFRQQVWHVRVWLILAVLFALLAALRISNLEEIWRDELRIFLRADAVYDGRRNFQRPIAATIIAILAAATFFGAYRFVRVARGRRNIAAIAAAAGGLVMTGLLALRLISLSPVDALLFGPLKLNWILDIGSSVLILGAAVYYTRLIRSRR